MLRVEDIEIIRAFRDGDLGAFNEVVAEFREPLTRHAMRRLHDLAAAEDAVQETFARAYRSFDRLHEASRIGPWLHHILSNVCIDEANRRRRDLERTERVSADPMSRRSVPGVEQQLGLDLDTSSLADALETLPEGYQNALKMRFVEDLSYAEIAASSGLSEQNVRARVSRARTAVRLALRGVAAFPIAISAFVIKRASRTAAVAEATAHRADTAIGATKFATHIGPAVEAANSLAVSAQTSAPLISKAAVGIGAIAMAAVSANPERSVVIPPAPPAISAPAEAEPAPAAESAPQLSLAAVPEPTETASATENEVAITPAVDAVAGEETAAEVSDTASEGTSQTSPAAGSETGSEPGSETGAETDAEAPSTDEDLAEEPVVLAGGVARATAVTLTAVGARTDLAGTLELDVNGRVHTGAFTGRWAIDTETDRSGAYRLSAVVTVTIDGTPVELRLAGHAQPSDESTDVRTLTGLFRAANNAAAGLVEAGSFTGSMGPDSLVLRLTP